MGADLRRTIDCENRARCASSTGQTLIRDLNQRNLLPRHRWNIPLAEILHVSRYNLAYLIAYTICINFMTIISRLYTSTFLIREK